MVQAYLATGLRRRSLLQAPTQTEGSRLNAAISWENVLPRFGGGVRISKSLLYSVNYEMPDCQPTREKFNHFLKEKADVCPGAERVSSK